VALAVVALAVTVLLVQMVPLTLVAGAVGLD
jgi:hypothetical protein